MKELVVISVYPAFREAASRAKSLAVELGEVVQLERRGAGWAVLATTDPEALLIDDPALSKDDWYLEEAERNVEEEEYDWDVLKPIREELESDRHDWARSEETGWFYSDED